MWRRRDCVIMSMNVNEKKRKERGKRCLEGLIIAVCESDPVLLLEFEG